MEQSVFYRETGPYGSQLVRSVRPDNQIVQYQLQLMTRSRPRWTVSCYLRYQNGQPQICHEITGLKAMDSFFEAYELCSDTGVLILKVLLKHLLAAEDYLMPINQFSLHPSNIYCTVDSTAFVDIQLVFWPIREQPDKQDELSLLIRSLLDSFNMAESEKAFMTAYQSGGIRKLAMLLETKDPGESRADNDREKTLCPTDKLAQIGSRLLSWLCQSKEVIVTNISRLLHELSSWLNYKAHEDQQQDNQTVLLPADPANFRMALIAAGKPGTPEENEGLRAYILVDEFMIGRDLKTCDLCLNESGIGRQHARILRRAGSFYIIDLGSRNGTYMDSKRLVKNAESLLPDQCVLQFADQTYYFQAD